MPLKQFGSLSAFQFESFSPVELIHGIFSRRGGVSRPPFTSLNVGGTVGDDPQAVAENRRRLFQSAGQPLDSLADVWQVHSADVVVVRQPRREAPPVQADAMVCNTPGITLFMRFADCVPILLYDPQTRAIGLAHAGWVGTLKGVVAATVERMRQEYGSRPGDLLAGIGPSIGAHHYPVGPEVVDQAQVVFQDDLEQVIQRHHDRECFDLWRANQLLLQRAGVAKIEISATCTACEAENWYSYRRDGANSGRLGTILALRDGEGIR